MNKFDFVNSNDGFGHQHMFGTASSESITFLSSSQNTADLSFARDNFVVVDNILTSSNFSTTLQASYHLNDVLLNRNGPYGWPTWKQLRNSQNPLVIKHMRTNTYSRVFWGTQDTSGAAATIRKSNTTPSMNILMNYEPIRDEGYAHNDPYEVALRHATEGEDQSSSLLRVVKNYNENPLTDRFRSATMTIHTFPAPDPEREDVINDLAGYFEFGPRVNPADANAFQLLDTRPTLIQHLRQNRWYMDALYYENRDEVDPVNDLSYAINELERQPLTISDPDTYLGNVSIRHTFQNNITMYANRQIEEDINHEDDLTKSDFFNFVIDITDENRNGNNNLIELNYIEKLYPREINTFSKKSRERELFDYFPWKSKDESRNNILSGNISYDNTTPLLAMVGLKAFPTSSVLLEHDYKNTYLTKYDAIDVSSLGGKLGSTTDSRISGSTWLLDARSNFSSLPADINISYFNDINFHATRDQGIRFEGVLQNDFSTFPLGYNGLYGTPPFSLVYNRRIPQEFGSKLLLAGEAKWTASSGSLGPFYDSYKDYSYETIRLVGQDHSIVSEFRMSEYAEDILTGKRSYPEIGDDYLSLTGAIHQNPEGQVSLAGKFFDTYSNSDFLKYFKHYDDQVEGLEYTHTRINFKCTAAMKFLPYNGFIQQKDL